MTASTLEKFAKKLIDGPIGKKFREDERKATLSERRQAVKAIKDKEKIILDALPGGDDPDDWKSDRCTTLSFDSSATRCWLGGG